MDVKDLLDFILARKKSSLRKLISIISSNKYLIKTYFMGCVKKTYFMGIK